MIEPFCHGPALVEEIRRTAPAPGTLAVWWLGQSGFLFKSRQGMLAVDLYLSEHLTTKYAGTSRPHVRMTAPTIHGSDLHEVAIVLASHKHSDHLDPGTLPELLACSRAILVMPESIREHTLSLGLPEDRLVGVDAGDVVDCGGFQVRAVPAAHEGLDTDAAGRHLYLGYVIESEGLRLYHSGDSLAFEGLPEQLGPERLDVMFLPINGRDPARGVPGNMTAGEAVELAKLVRPRFVVPHHYDMFTFNTVSVDVFIEQARRLNSATSAKVLRCGERWEILP
jgi:L-ascorbate 6-phosphate lactonase